MVYSGTEKRPNFQWTSLKHDMKNEIRINQWKQSREKERQNSATIREFSFEDADVIGNMISRI